MNTRRFVFLASFMLVIGIFPVMAQDGASFRDEFLNHFNMSSRKFVALAEAMPADKYAWSPGEGVMSIQHVYMHVARYNYNYPVNNLGMALPEGIDLDSMEEITGKNEVIEHLKRSIEYVHKVTEELGAEGLGKPTKLYGRDVEGWNVLFQLITHMNEHLGQSIAYARMNGVVPSWSQ